MGLFIALGFIPERVIAGLGEMGVVIAHDIRHSDADALLLVIQHQHGAAIGAQTNLQRAIRIVGIERHPFDLFGVIHLHIAIVEKGDMRGVLASDGLADVAVTFVVVDRFGGCLLYTSRCV